MKLRLLANEYKSNGFMWKILERTENKVIAEKVDAPTSYEVFLVKRGLPHPMYNEDNYDQIEKIPGNEDFGSFAWSFKDKLHAYEVYNRLPSKYVKITRSKGG